MKEHFDANKVLSLAQSIEENAIEFYKNAYKLHPKKNENEFLLKLAEIEKEHKETYAAMQAEIKEVASEPSGKDFLNDIDLYLKAVIDSQSLEGSKFASMLLRGDESLREILLIAMDLEKETILFYIGLKDVVTSSKDKKIVDKIIQEEKNHIVTLAEELQGLF